MFVSASSVRVVGPLAGCSPGLIAGLASRGYAPATLAVHAGRMALLSSWMKTDRVRLADLNEDVIARLVLKRHRAGKSLSLTATSFAHVLTALRAEGVTGPAPVAAPIVTPLDELLESFRAYEFRMTSGGGGSKPYLTSSF